MRVYRSNIVDLKSRNRRANVRFISWTACSRLGDQCGIKIFSSSDIETQGSPAVINKEMLHVCGTERKYQRLVKERCRSSRSNDLVRNTFLAYAMP